MNHRDDGDADVDFAVVDAHLDAAVLRQAFLGDIEPRHNLEPANDGSLKAVDLRRQRLCLQHAVDAIPNVQGAFAGLDVNVAGPFIGRLHEHFIDELDDRGLLSHFGQLAVVSLGVLQQLDAVPIALANHGGDGFAADAEMGLDEASDLLGAGEHRSYLQAGQGLQLVEGVNVKWIAGGDDQRAVFPRQRHEVVPVNEADGNGSKRLRLNRHARQVRQFQAELLGQQRQHVLFLRKAAVDEQFVKRSIPGRCSRFFNSRQVRFGQQSFLDELLHQLHRHLKSARQPRRRRTSPGII